MLLTKAHCLSVGEAGQALVGPGELHECSEAHVEGDGWWDAENKGAHLPMLPPLWQQAFIQASRVQVCSTVWLCHLSLVSSYILQ